jgi:hypothetical protein
MSALPWITYGQRAAARNDPLYPDIVNGPLRTLLSQSGYDPDADPAPVLPNFGPAVVLAYQMVGATAGQQIQAAITALAATGGVVDCRGFVGPIVLDVDVFAGLAAYSTVAFTLLFGPQDVRLAVKQWPRSHTTIVMEGTHFMSAKADGSAFTPSVDTINGFDIIGTNQDLNVTVALVDGSAIITKAVPSDPKWGALEAGSPIAVLGRLPYLCKDNTTINVGGGIDAATASITVVSTAGFPTSNANAANFIRIEDEVIQYTSVDATHFLGCTRGYGGTTATTHADTTAVERPIYEPFVVSAIAGDSITLDAVLDPRATMDLAATAMPAFIGALDVRFEGVGVIDGNMATQNGADDNKNPQGVRARWARRLYIGPGVEIRNWDHGGASLEAVQDCRILANVQAVGNFTAHVGTGVWLFGQCKRNYVHVENAYSCEAVVNIDDRSVVGQIVDGPCVENTVVLEHANWCRRGVSMDGGQKNRIVVRNCVNGQPNLIGVQFGAGQWVTLVAGDGNHADIGIVDAPSFSQQHFVATSVYVAPRINSVTVWQGSPVVVIYDGISLVTPDFLLGATYSTSITPSPQRAEDLQISITDGVAFAINNPAITQRARGRRMRIRIANISGGAHGAITLGGDYRLQGGGSVLPAIANGQHRWFHFMWTGSVWDETGRSAADVAN